LAKRAVEFGYNPPTGDRGTERIEPRTFVRDLQHVLDFASQHFSSLWVSDHLALGDKFRLECWTQLIWMAARYPGPKLGTNVMASSFRHPSLMAKMAASLQFLSQGRLILGYGAGWLEHEYRAYGYDFPPPRVRIAQLDEAIRVMRALWTEAPATFEGQYYRVQDAYCEPRPDPPPALMIAGDGEKYLLPVVAEHADWWLAYARPPDQQRRKVEALKQHCRAIGRDFASIRMATPLVVYLARSRAEAERWAGPALEREQPAFAGDPAALRDRLAELIDLGFEQFQLVFAGWPELDDIKLFVDEVLPAFR
jgi:alkanesulfonate monooxygenase SsuD/methylene tetrahydromethanopterin reductase-like flavin-dependent oxidoreductase (luciferase family)